MNYLKVPDVGLQQILATIINYNFCPDGSSPGITFGLYQENYAPEASDTIAVYEASGFECDFSGYVETSLVPTTATYTQVGDTWVAQMPQITFTADGGISAPQTAYGYFCWTGASGFDSLLFAQLFQTPQTVTNPGDIVTFIPQFGDLSQY